MSKFKILIQAGHVAPREPGFESGTGTKHEQEFTLRMRTLLANRFRADGRFAVTESPGDIPNGWAGDVALYLHLDGSGNPSASGMSFGYQTAQGQVLAQRIRAGFIQAGHPGMDRRDNYTNALQYYYGFSRTNATHEVLIEHGFGTNPGEYAWMEINADRLADATYNAVLKHLGLKQGGLVRNIRQKANRTKEDILRRNRITIKRTLPTGEVTTWQGWRSDGTGANGVLRVLALTPEGLDFRTKYDIAWQGRWFLQDEYGRDGIINVAKSIWSRFS